MSGNRREEDFEIPWPAFVDLLTSVLITFMFFILITTVAMSTMTMKTVEDMAKKRDENPTADSRSAESEPTLQPPPEFTPPTPAEENQLKKENQALKEELVDIKQQMAAFRVPLNKATEISLEQEKKVLTLLFKRNEIGMMETTSAAIKGFIAQGGHINAVTLIAVEPQALGVSQAREQALARALNVRNVLIQEGLSPKIVEIRYIPTTAVHNSTDWVRIELR